MKSIIVAAGLVMLLGGCFAEKLARGEGCELTSECDAPLICRLGKCRVECVTNRDCALGLNCLYDQSKLGACQLAAESGCAINSDCDLPLVCRMETCTTECNDDVDCPPGATCMGTAPETACVDLGTKNCVYNTECPDAKKCASDGRCRDECLMLGDGNCRPPLICREFDTDAGLQRFCDLPL